MFFLIICNSYSNLLTMFRDPRTETRVIAQGPTTWNYPDGTVETGVSVVTATTRRQRRFGFIQGFISAGLVSAAVVCADEVFHFTGAEEPSINDMSRIVAGVPAQIHETWRDTETGALGFVLEQCPADILPAQVGQLAGTGSLDLSGVQIGESCISDQLVVSQTTYDSYEVGDVITFPGNPGHEITGY